MDVRDVPTLETKALTPRRVAGAYLLFAVAWIVGSDWVLALLVSPERAERLQTVKGIAFILVTAVLLYVLLRRNSAAINKRDLYFRQLIEHALDAIAVFNVDGTLRYVSPGVSAVLGYDPAALIGSDAFRLVHPDDAAGMVNLVRHGSTVAGFAQTVEVRLRHADGTWRWVEGVGRNLHDDPVVGGGVFNFRDVTERKQVEAERGRLARAVEQAADGMIITDAAGTIVYVNPAFERITGYTADEVVGKNPRVLKSGRQDTRFYKTMWATLGRGVVWTGRVTNRRKDGTTYDAEAVISPMRGPAGEVTHYVGAQRDVTREVQLENQLRQAQKLEAVGQLTGGIAHDFNNILAVVIANAELVAEGLPADREDLRADLADLRAAARSGSVMVKKLLGFSRRANLAPVPTNLAALVTELSSLMRRVLPPNIDIVAEVAPNVPAVLADPGAVQQILLNLVTNARDAMLDGGRIIIAIRDLDAFVCLSVSDTGSGMDEATKTRVFEPFFTTKASGKGTGLGMAMVHGLVMQHGGLVEVESALARGTTVRVCLPVAGSGDEPAAVPGLGDLRGGTETILVAEDEAALRRSACRLLARLGYRVLSAADGQEALDLCRARGAEIHLVVADGQMPRLSGPDLYDVLQRERPEIRFLLASGYTVDDGSDGSNRSVGIPFLAKPWTLAELSGRVREVLDQQLPSC